MSIPDRGSIKWNSLMLPEHRTYLQKLLTADQKTSKPILDEQQLVRMEKILRENLDSKDKTLHITYHRRGKLHSIDGKILLMDPSNKKITIEKGKEQFVILAEELIDVKK